MHERAWLLPTSLPHARFKSQKGNPSGAKVLNYIIKEHALNKLCNFHDMLTVGHITSSYHRFFSLKHSSDTSSCIPKIIVHIENKYTYKYQLGSTWPIHKLRRDATLISVDLNDCISFKAPPPSIMLPKMVT